MGVLIPHSTVEYVPEVQLLPNDAKALIQTHTIWYRVGQTVMEALPRNCPLILFI